MKGRDREGDMYIYIERGKYKENICFIIFFLTIFYLMAFFLLQMLTGNIYKYLIYIFIF